MDKFSEDLVNVFFDLFLRQECEILEKNNLDVQVQKILKLRAEIFVEQYYDKINQLLDDFLVRLNGKKLRYAIVHFDGKGGSKETIFLRDLEEVIVKLEDDCVWGENNNLDPETLSQFTIFDMKKKQGISSWIAAFILEKHGIKR